MTVSGAKCPRQQDPAVMPGRTRARRERSSEGHCGGVDCQFVFCDQNSFMNQLPLKNDKPGGTLQI